MNPRGAGDCTSSSAAGQILAVAIEMRGEEAVDDRIDVRTQDEDA